ncbi:hypothetical protein DID77_01570 [Candidatus Marinamargulisbacteria bacterium SCGC AG-439-L15]|nr:hypothetical protein DID77_01570 [Candidatus Marinamargulisbacteria bacterium SCGC AG-439-L15]
MATPNEMMVTSTLLGDICAEILSYSTQFSTSRLTGFQHLQDQFTITPDFINSLSTLSFKRIREDAFVEKADLPDHPNFSILKIPPNTDVPKHRHNGYESLLFLKGEEFLSYNSNEIVHCQTGDLLISLHDTAHLAKTRESETLILGYWEKGSEGVQFSKDPD